MEEKDRQLFRNLVGEVEPLKNNSGSPARPTSEKTPGMRFRRRAAEAITGTKSNGLDGEEWIVPVKPWDQLYFKRDGVQHGVFKKLRLGYYLVDARLDLHGMTVEEARQGLLDYVEECCAHHLRCVLIAHGRGEGREKPALLKSCINHWLRQMDAVLAFHSAQRQHGGSGATYVLLRKSHEKSEENREHYSRRIPP